MTTNKRVRVRFAPSPTGPLHIGGLRTALYNYLFAKKHDGDFILRIEDTDQSRFVQGAEAYIIESLKWCGIEPNEGTGFGDGTYYPYRQSERKSMYRQYAEQLVKDGYAYYAFDTSEDLEDMRLRMERAGKSFAYNAITRQSMKNSLVLSEDEVKKRMSAEEPYVIRIKIPRNEEIRFYDLIRQWVVVHSSQMDDKVLFKSDGMPTYHLANVVDDYLMKISHVIRGEEWLPSAPLHVLLYRYLGWHSEGAHSGENAMPAFAHLPLLLRPDGNGKLSKRDGDRLGFPVFPLNWKDPITGEESSGYRERGYFPEAVINILALLGWHTSGNKEIFSLEELVQDFSLERVSKHGAKFDHEKAKWLNQQYLRAKSDEELTESFLAVFKEKLKLSGDNEHLSDGEYIKKVCTLLKEKASFVNEFWSLGNYFFVEPVNYDAGVIKKRWNPRTKNFIVELSKAYLSANNFSAAEAESIFKQICEKTDINSSEVMQLFRVCISGVAGGPALFEVAVLLGKDEVAKRLEAAVCNIT